MHHPGHRVSALAGQFEFAGVITVEPGAEPDQVVDPARTFVDQHPDRFDVAQPDSGGQCVGQVQVRFLRVARQGGRDAALGPPGRGLIERRLGQHPDPQARRLDSLDGGRQAGDPTAEYQQIEWFAHRWASIPTLSIKRARANCTAPNNRLLEGEQIAWGSRVLTSATST